MYTQQTLTKLSWPICYQDFQETGLWSLKDHLNFFTLKQKLRLQQHDNNINSNVQHSNSESRNSPRSDMQKVEGTLLPFANDVLTS